MDGRVDKWSDSQAWAWGQTNERRGFPKATRNCRHPRWALLIDANLQRQGVARWWGVDMQNRLVVLGKGLHQT